MTARAENRRPAREKADADVIAKLGCATASLTPAFAVYVWPLPSAPSPWRQGEGEGG